MSSNYKLYLTVVLVALVTGACNIFGTSPDLQPVHNPNDSDVEDLVSHTWVLSEFQTSDGELKKVKHKDEYELEFFADDTVDGTTVRNIFEGPYYANVQDSGHMNIEIGLRTMAGCGTEFDCNYLRRLEEKVDRYDVNNSRLKLGFGEEGVLLYRKR